MRPMGRSCPLFHGLHSNTTINPTSDSYDQRSRCPGPLAAASAPSPARPGTQDLDSLAVTVTAAS
eukprot:2539457-Rhodomonas_salina.1